MSSQPRQTLGRGLVKGSVSEQGTENATAPPEGGPAQDIVTSELQSETISVMEILEISMSTIVVRSKEPLPVGEIIEVSLGESLTVTAIVEQSVASRDQDGGKDSGYRISCRFEDDKAAQDFCLAAKKTEFHAAKIQRQIDKTRISEQINTNGAEEFSPSRSAAGTILLAEDNENIGNLVLFKLKASGYSATWHKEGKSAWEAIHSQKPALAILDIDLPGIDGIEILKRIRKNSATSTIPVLMLTANSDLMNVQQCVEQGANDYVVKPFKPSELMVRIRGLGIVPILGKPDTA